ncbi:histone-lysine N-methyltransferase eggless [Diachasma alloeum]|uniref:histone-lysine N-methyltransferase eggless n=1 Tax=Diachasma alloeum TaxID=454923 RepID=UPI0007384E6F|nr:histone-lysine N-methyltransferase eggless [Diachasma alloeum]
MAEEKMEVINLDSDDEEKRKLQDQKTSKKFVCINLKCESGVNMKTASSFACSYYGLNQAKKKKRYICDKCHVVAIEHQEMLAEAFFKREPLLKCELPDNTMQIDLSDSDSDGEAAKEPEECEYIPEDVLLDMETKIEDALSNVLRKYDVDYQLTEAQKILEAQFDDIDRSNEESDREIKQMISKMDMIRNSLYDAFRPDIKMLADLSIDDGPSMVPPQAPQASPRPLQRAEPPGHPTVATKKVTQVKIPAAAPPKAQDNQVEIMPIVEKVEKQTLGYGLPAHGKLILRPAEVDNIVLVMKHPLMPWIKAKVHAILTHQPMTYRVKFLPKKYNNSLRTVFGRQLAIHAPAPVIIPVATRVVAIFNDVNSSNYYSGVIAEPPKTTNKHRYLVFFDDGYAQYVAHKHIFVVSESSQRVWEDIPIESRDFVKKYIEGYPERPMVKLQPGQVVKTEWNGKWWVARVAQVDASLVQMSFDADNRTEWIYRGSTRLGPLYVELLKATARQQGHHMTVNAPGRHRIAPGGKANIPYVEYTSGTIEGDPETTVKEPPAASPKPPPQSRAVARKSTAKKPTVEPTYLAAAEAKSAYSIAYYSLPNSIKPKQYAPHECSANCIQLKDFKVDDLKGYSPLSIPLLCGWNRQICKYPKGKKVVMYQTPCGVRLRSIEEVHQYLRKTKSTISVDLFEFDSWVHCLAEFILDKCFVNIKDLSYGVENVAIPCVNELDHALPDPITYSTVRQPTEGVNLNLDPEFLCSCDCEDDCQDKEKCQCWQLTIQGAQATLGGRVPANNVGYHYKRLPEPVTTGIYECNSKCKCSVKTCLNRVVQHPLTLKLQVFKTQRRGWGIRCLNDIPVGSFICIYAGRLLTEQGANEGGKNYGDEYLAELDYVEVVENIKEGFEADVLDPDMPIESPSSKERAQEEERSTRRRTGPDGDADFDIRQYNTEYAKLDSEADDSMKKRLRKRKKSDEIVIQDVEDKSEDGSIGKSEDGSVGKSSTDNNQDGSDEEVKGNGRRELIRFEPTVEPNIERPKFKSVRDFFGEDEAVYIMDAKTTGNIGRYLNHSCDPNVFVQNVFVDTHDVRFPWVAFFALSFIGAGRELTWNYSYDVGSIPGKVIICKCGASNCRGRLL